MNDPDQPLFERTIRVASEEETDRLGRRIADAVSSGTVLALVGELGSGKTRLVRAIATALGADPLLVNSPTFVLIQQYDARLPVFHFDTYRLRDADEFAELGSEEYFSAGGVCLVEWADKVEELLPADHLRVEIEATGPTARTIRLIAKGPRSHDVLAKL